MSATPKWEGVSYDSHPDFYADNYAEHIVEARPTGRCGAVMIAAFQHAGDWSDAPTPDLVVSKVTSARSAPVSIDLGAGRFDALVRKDEIIVIPPRSATTILVDVAHSITLIAVPYERLVALAGEDCGLNPVGDFGPLHACQLRDLEISNLLDRMWNEGQAGNPHGALWADGALLQLAAALLRLQHSSPDVAVRSAARGGLASWQVRTVIDYLEEHLASDIALADLATLTGLSSFHFCRAFKTSTGLPPHRWRLARRIERAREMLETTSLPITEIAAAVGYENPGHLAVTFRKAVGLSPTQYRSQHRTGGPVRHASPGTRIPALGPTRTYRVSSDTE